MMFWRWTKDYPFSTVKFKSIKREKQLERITGLEDQVIYEELYNQCKNLCFLGVLESMVHVDVEDTKEVVYHFLERDPAKKNF